MLPRTQYAKSGKVSIAYQVTGDGPIDVILAPEWVSNVEYAWESPDYARFITHMSSFSRFIRFDKRGTGLSDRDGPPPTLEQRVDDIRAVLDAVGSKHAALLGMSEGGNMSIMFAATHPERTMALVLFSSFARANGHPIILGEKRRNSVMLIMTWSRRPGAGRSNSLRRLPALQTMTQRGHGSAPISPFGKSEFCPCPF
jgi:pimeloyl-ACP methyl ester carboxylesterase